MEKHPDVAGRLVLLDQEDRIKQCVKLGVGIEATVHDFFTEQAG